MIHMSSKKIDDFEAYRIFLAMKSHFNNDYDYVKYNGRITAKLESYSKRKDRHTFINYLKNLVKKNWKNFFFRCF